MLFLNEVQRAYFLIAVLVLAVVVFAIAPLVIYLARNKDYTKQGLLVVAVQSSWLLFANALCALMSIDYCLQRYGQTLGVIVSILVTAFGGTIFLGVYEFVLNKRQAIGRKLGEKVYTILTTEPVSDSEPEKQEAE